MRIELAQKIRVVLPAGDPRAADGALINHAPIWADPAAARGVGGYYPEFKELRLDAGTRYEIDDEDFAWFAARYPGLLVPTTATEVDRIGGRFPGVARAA